MYIIPQDREQQIIYGSIENNISKYNPVRLVDILVKTIINKNPEQYIYKGLSSTGRPAYLVETMVKIYIYGYIN
jgi:transposase